MKSLAVCLCVLAVLLVSAMAAPSLSADGVTVGGSVQFWGLYEQATNGKQQDVTADPGAQEASGFSVNRARVFARFAWGEASPGTAGGAYLQARLENGSFALLDAVCAWRPLGEALELDVGQMKIPSSWETMSSDDSLDFITRSRFAAEVANWSLSKSPFSTSPFFSLQTYQRDMGAALKGSLRGLDFMLMAGNGLGANAFVGAYENPQFVFANSLGAWFYGARLSYDLLAEAGDRIGSVPCALLVGGHYSNNDHPNLIYGDGKTVLDLLRRSWSIDARLRVFERLRITGMYGEGLVLDDFDNDGAVDYLYRGWEVRVIAVVAPDILEAGVRYDSYAWSRAVTSGWAEAAAVTAGVTLSWAPHWRLQLNYKWKLQSGDLVQRTESSVVCVAVQVTS